MTDYRTNPAAYHEGIPAEQRAPGGRVAGVCRSCGRALWGGPGGWHDVMGYENCPTPWVGQSVFHEPMFEVFDADDGERGIRLVGAWGRVR